MTNLERLKKRIGTMDAPEMALFISDAKCMLRGADNWRGSNTLPSSPDALEDWLEEDGGEGSDGKEPLYIYGHKVFRYNEPLDKDAVYLTSNKLEDIKNALEGRDDRTSVSKFGSVIDGEAYDIQNLWHEYWCYMGVVPAGYRMYGRTDSKWLKKVVRRLDGNGAGMIGYVRKYQTINGRCVRVGDRWISLLELLLEYEWDDGTPCGELNDDGRSV